MQRSSPILMTLIGTIILMMAVTAVLLWVRGRPDSPTETTVVEPAAESAENVAADEAAQGEATPIPEPVNSGISSDIPPLDTSSGQVQFEKTINGIRVVLVPFDNEQIAMAPENTTVVIVPNDTAAADEPAEDAVNPEPAQDQAPTPVPPTPEPTATIQPTPIVIPDAAPTQVVVQPAADQGTSPVTFVNYTVVNGDTLYRISTKHNTTVELMAEHGISSRDVVIDSVLEIPVANPNYCPNHSAYVVREADTVFRISRNRGTTVDLIRDLNGLNANFDIRAGQILCVP